MKTVLLALALLVSSLLAQAQADTSAAEQIFNSLNRERTSRGLKPLAFDARLMASAQQHSATMAEHHAISHQFPKEPSPTERLIATGVRLDATGENVAVSQDAAGAHSALMNSPPHRANILNPNFNAVGIATFHDDRGSLYVTQDFAHTVTEYSIPEAEQRITDFVAQLRRDAGATRLPVIDRPELRKLACEMARNDFLSMDKIRALPGVSTTVVFTSGDLSDFPKNLQRLKTAHASGMSVGVCYAASASQAIPAYWVAVVTYF
jgi:Cysteine-rich secretory protein family